MRSRRTYGLLAVAALAAATATAVTTPEAGAAAAGCRVSYTISSQWQGGFGANVAVTNLGDPVTAWTLRWSFGAGQAVTQAWNATVTQSGAAATAVNVSYNARSAPVAAPRSASTAPGPAATRCRPRSR